MNRDVGAWVSPLVAVLVLGVVCAQVFAALRVTGAFGWHTAAPHVTVSPAYRSVEQALDQRDPHFTLGGMRDPFAYAHELETGVPAPRPQHAPAPSLPPELPVLTAIVWDNDPRALIRWKKREWTVRDGGLFDEFQVIDIIRDQVTLRRGDETLVLHRRNPGD
jgi:hypothetical protein